MVLLENIDFKNISVDKFRPFKCPCELCDDGCFDRLKQKHHPECKRSLENKSWTTNDVTLKSSNNQTHYKDTFKPNHGARPATTYQPPPNLFEYVPKGPFDFNTIQKTEYKPFEITNRTKSFKTIDNYERSIEPMTGVSSYKATYLNNENSSFATRVKKNPNEITMKLPVDSISSSTTTKEHFKDWNSQPPGKGFSEYPSYAGDSLFPTSERNFNTSTSTVHHEIPLPAKNNTSQVNAIKGSLRNEGEMNLITNYRDAYVKYSEVDRTKKIVPTSKENVIEMYTRYSPNISQTKTDYVSYPDHNPPKPADCNPYVSDLDSQIYPGNKHDHTTNYSREFVGFDLNKIQKTKSFKAENKAYERPLEKIDAETVTKRDFKPIDVKQVPPLKAIKLSDKLKIPAGPMETQTMSKIQFPAYDVKPVVLGKDPNPYVYIPTKSKFTDETTNGITYRGTKGPKARTLKPEFGSIELTGSIDLNTNYKDAYVNHGISMCEAKAFLIASSLKNKDSNLNNKLSNPQLALANSVSS